MSESSLISRRYNNLQAPQWRHNSALENSQQEKILDFIGFFHRGNVFSRCLSHFHASLVPQSLVFNRLIVIDTTIGCGAFADLDTDFPISKKADSDGEILYPLARIMGSMELLRQGNTVTAHLSLGSNLGERVQNLHLALEALRGIGRISALSSLYETEPVGEVAQPWFFNAAAALETELPPVDLLRELLSIEQRLGRKRLIAKGPRTIDLDLLFYGESVMQTVELTLPHPALHGRRFVLEPLCEIAPSLRHPLLGVSIKEMLLRLPVGGPAVHRAKVDGWMADNLSA